MANCAISNRKNTSKTVSESMEILQTDPSVMKILTNLLKESRDEWLVQTTALINQVNPMVDRIMDDESVEVVVMANTEGLPILTNVNVLGATNYATAIHHLSTMVQTMIKDMDPLDETLVFRMKTSKAEVMTAPHKEFSIIIVQHAREKKTKKKKKQHDNKNMETYGMC